MDINAYETTYVFAPKAPTGSPAAEWVAQADASEELRGTLNDAVQLAAELGCSIELRDAAGFHCGMVAANGAYQLA